MWQTGTWVNKCLKMNTRLHFYIEFIKNNKLVRWRNSKCVAASLLLLSGTKKFDRGLSLVMHVDLHWLDVPQRVKYKLTTRVYNCLHGKAPSYLTDCCTAISDVASRRHLRSANRRQLLVPRHNLNWVWSFLSRVRLPGTAWATNCVNRC